MYGVRFRGTPAVIERLMNTGEPYADDIYLDWGVSGNHLDRPALTALLKEIERDTSVSHVFVPRRERLARPDAAIDGVQLEHRIRSLGVYLIFQDKILPPVGLGERADISELITGCIDYDASGKFRESLAEKMIDAQIQLA